MLSRPKLGVCTWIFGDLPLVEVASRLTAMRYDGVELLADFTRYSAKEAQQILREYDLTVFSLTPDNVDLAHPETAVRQQAIDYYMRLLDFAVDLGHPLVSCHGYVGRIRPLTTMAEEKEWLMMTVRYIAEEAQKRALRLVFEVLNRYETHLINTATEALTFLEALNCDNVGVLLDAYHMNIEEQDAATAIRTMGDKLWLYHMADSNRQAIGRGHTKLGAHLWALEDIGYDGPIIMECTAPGPDPFTPIKDEHSLDWLETYLQESRSWF